MTTCCTAGTTTGACTCPVPKPVDLTKSYAAKHQVVVGGDENNIGDCAIKSDSSSLLLLQNLRSYGWSHLSIDCSKIPATSPLCFYSECSNNLWQHPKRGICKLFDPEFRASNPFPQATFRTAESGSAGNASVEPKQSWESRRCFFYNGQKEDEGNPLLYQISHGLHSIISTVNYMLKLPPNLLIQETQEKLMNESYGCSCVGREQNATNKTGPCNVDLLRVFLYDKVEPPNCNKNSKNEEKNDNRILGSSPHTDWGSFTIVWQDTVGGLQTFCQTCQAWNNVQAFGLDDETSDILHFVVHVGDATSLAMAHSCNAKNAFSISNDDCNNSTGTQQQSSSASPSQSPKRVIFPSPKHRVLSPSTEPRASLVYFVYPPPGQSLSSLQKGLAEWWQSPSNGESTISSDDGSQKCAIPYDEYFLLHDQSLDGTTASRTPMEVFASIRNKPLEQVWAEKWQQVQRSS